jgi:hypothetical protein
MPLELAILCDRKTSRNAEETRDLPSSNGPSSRRTAKIQGEPANCNIGPFQATWFSQLGLPRSGIAKMRSLELRA